MPASVTLIVLRSPDLRRARAFYEALGLAFVEEQHGAGPRHLAATLDSGLVIELYPAEASTGVAADLRLGFAVANLPDTLARLRSLGVDVPATTTAVTVTDPDGRRVVLEPGT